MNKISRTITGIIGMILGLFLTTLGFWKLIALIYGIPIFIISIFILFNKKEDSIEEIKKR
jgi:uncharacterized membrane protein